MKFLAIFVICSLYTSQWFAEAAEVPLRGHTREEDKSDVTSDENNLAETEKFEALRIKIEELGATFDETDKASDQRTKRTVDNVPDGECGTDDSSVQVGALRLSGIPGMAGSQGPAGPAGPPGEAGRDGLSLADINVICNYRDAPVHSGAVYVHWGRPDCPSESTLVYSGVAGGSRHRDLPGGGANLLCLPSVPEFERTVEGEGEERSFIFNVEYQISHFPEMQYLHLQDVSCSVCQATNRFSHLMIPAKLTCPDNWTFEYKGYLMAERSHPVHHKSSFICVDKDHSPVPNSLGESENVALLNLVETKCSSSDGGLPCSSYPDGYEFSCVVCSK